MLKKLYLMEFHLKEVTIDDGIWMKDRTILRLNGEFNKSNANLIKETLDKQLKK